MVHDRGSIKWTTMMLPEHAELLKELWKEDKKVTKPILDSQQVEVLENKLVAALQDSSLVELTFYRSAKIQVITGTIVKLDEHTQLIHVQLQNKTTIRLPFHSIQNVH